jgi:uncharacterized protein YecT (DUF1311 family)
MPVPIPGRARNARTFLLLAPLLLATGAAHAAVSYPNLAAARKEIPVNAQWYRQCLQVRYLNPPPHDLPRLRTGGHCDATALYYDAKSKRAPTDADWQAVRECAFRTGDNAVLMMLYANGAGVAPNLGLAMKYACSTQSSVPEMQHRLARLTRSGTRGHIDQCDDISSGGKVGLCAGARAHQANKARADEILALAQAWAPKEKMGFEMALQAARHFAQHRRDYETDLGSVARTRLQAEAEAAELERFSTDVEQFEGGKPPRYTEAEFAALEDKMNQVYQQFMQNAPGPDAYLGTIRKSGVEKTQRAWLAYRDAMELFGSIRYPDVPPSGWRALLTARRLRQLTELNNAELGK